MDLNLLKHDGLPDCYELADGFGYHRKTIATGLTGKNAGILLDALQGFAQLHKELKEARKLIRELLANAEIDSLNEPELEPLCDRATKFLAK